MFLLKSIFTFMLLCVVGAQTEYEQLPNCLENHVPGLVLVSTIDGKFSALTSEGALQWQIDTEPGPLLVSNIHNLELTNSGKWIRIIPSLNGALYRFDGVYIDPISISAESLLRSSFKYSDDLVIAGGLEVRTYGIGFRSGKIFYTCSTLNCINNTNSDEVEDLLLLERTTQIVRAVEAQSGHERWNFSVGQHNIKSTQVSCMDPNVNLFNWNITAIVPDGLLLASNYQDNVRTTWQYHFTSPIVRVWKWNGHKLIEIDLFRVKNEDNAADTLSPALYVGMHKKQLYINEAFVSHRHMTTAVADTKRIGRIPWKPISASGLLTEDDSTAMSVLYSSEYVNGHGYYLYSDKEKGNALCEKNYTFTYPALSYISKADTIRWFFSVWWMEIMVITLTTTFLCHFMFRSLTRRQQQKQVIFVERPVEVPQKDSSSGGRVSESSDSFFTSRYLNDFDTLRCLGKGGFGVVFEVKQKIDECNYAIKRIVLPNEKSKRETVMREVKALAKLEHHNIVRYFNSWVEQPPPGWQQQHDGEWIKEASEFPTETTTNHNTISSVNQNASFKMEDSGLTDSCRYISHTRNKSNDSFIVFDDGEENSFKSNESNKTDTLSCEDTQNSGSVNWRRPSRRYHCINDTVTLPKDPPTFLYIQMQLCQKQSLREWLVENRDRDFTDILHIFKQIVSAVEYVHLQGLIHRDLKPSNIFFSLDGQIKVGDFGLVKDEEESHDASNGFNSLIGHTREVGTRLYMSPEQLNGQKYNYKVDIYSLGLIFFELLVYFGTDMERIRTMTELRDDKYPKNFIEQYTNEYNLLKMMLCQLPEKRLTTFGIRARPPLNNCDSDYSETYDFELPKTVRPASLSKT